jgi:hypothetical protein
LAELVTWDKLECSPRHLNSRSWGFGNSLPITYEPEGLFFLTTDNALFQNIELDRSKPAVWQDWIASEAFVLGNILALT